jgi:hypothetical protein
MSKACVKIFIKYFEHIKLAHNRNETKKLHLLVEQIAREFIIAKIGHLPRVYNQQQSHGELGQMRENVNERVEENHAIQILFTLLNKFMLRLVVYLLELAFDVVLESF